MLYLSILAQKFLWEIWCQNMQKGWGGTREDTPEKGIITACKEIVPILDVGCGIWGEGTLWNILTNRICTLVPPFGGAQNPQTRIHRIPTPTRLSSLPGHPNFARTRWHPITMVYRKQTHTDKYLHWESHHRITYNYTWVQIF